MRFRFPFLLLALAAGAAGAATTEVMVADPGKYSDVGRTRAEEHYNVQVLGRHIEQLGQRLLPASYVLKVEVLDVDLAGSVRPGLGGREMVRTIRSAADLPSMHLRYTLQAPGQQARTGEDRISDIDFLNRPDSFRAANQTLFYEKRMLEDWFKRTFQSPG